MSRKAETLIAYSLSKLISKEEVKRLNENAESKYNRFCAKRRGYSIKNNRAKK